MCGYHGQSVSVSTFKAGACEKMPSQKETPKPHTISTYLILLSIASI